MADILVLATKEEQDAKEGDVDIGNDLFTQVEAEIILKMKAMNLEDLINLMWSALEINRGGQFFYETLEGELSKRIRGIKDEQFETLIACFSGDKGGQSMSQFSSKFLDLVVRVMNDKRDRF